MAALVVGGVECEIEETQVTLGHVVVPLRDIVVFGVAKGPAELVVVYERRGAERGYRDARGAVRTRATTTLALHGEHDVLIAWLRERIPDRWRGYEETIEHVVDGRPPPEPPRRIALRAAGAIGIALALALITAVAFVWYQERRRASQSEPLHPPGYVHEL